jgi:DNA-binding IclR family transcriptional regulator
VHFPIAAFSDHGISDHGISDHGKGGGTRVAGNSVDIGRSVTNKVSSIILLFGTGRDFSLSEVARLTCLPMSTAHRLIAELLTAGLLSRTHQGRYRVGDQLRDITRAAAPAPSLHERARRIMEDLAIACGHAQVRLGVLEGLDVASIAKDRDNRPVPSQFDATLMPLHATAMGKALLAFASASTVDQVIARGLERYTEFTIASPHRLRQALATVRLARVATASREFRLHEWSLAAPVFGPGGVVVAALEVTVGKLRDMRLLQPPVTVAARVLSRELRERPDPAVLVIRNPRQFDVMIAG